MSREMHAYLGHLTYRRDAFRRIADLTSSSSQPLANCGIFTHWPTNDRAQVPTYGHCIRRRLSWR